MPSQKNPATNGNGHHAPPRQPESVWSLDKRIEAAQSQIRIIEKTPGNRIKDPSKEFPPFTEEAAAQIQTLKSNIHTWQKQKINLA